MRTSGNVFRITAVILLSISFCYLIFFVYDIHNETSPQVLNADTKETDDSDLFILTPQSLQKIDNQIFSFYNVNDESKLTAISKDLDISLPEEQCFNGTYLSQSGSFPMCLRTRGAISNIIRKKGQWIDCMIIPRIYEYILSHIWLYLDKDIPEQFKYEKSNKLDIKYDKYISYNNHNEASLTKYKQYILDNYNVFMLDVGANIGSCSFEMYSRNYDKLNIISFEPASTNLYYFKKTLIYNYNNFDLKDKRYFLFEGGITYFNTTEMNSDVPFKISNITIQRGNFGQTHFGSRRRLKNEIESSLNLTSIDYIFNYLLTKYSNIYDINKLIIPFIKIDTEGFESNVLFSAIKLMKLRKIICIKFEFTPMWESRANHSFQEVLRYLDHNGYDVYSSFTPDAISGDKNEYCKHFLCAFKGRLLPEEVNLFSYQINKYMNWKQTELYALLRV